MDQKCLRGSDLVVDIENGDGESSKDGSFCSRNPDRQVDVRVWDAFPGNVGCCGEGKPLISQSTPSVVSVPVEDLVGEGKFGSGGGQESGFNLEKKQKKKNIKKPPKPPRPPKAPSLDEADQKLIRELTEVAMLKRARMERMKALKKMKNNTKTTSSNANVWAFIVTAIFCFIVLWQGFCSRNNSQLGFEGSPLSSLRNNGGLISIQYYGNVPPIAEASLSSSASPARHV